MLDLFKKGFPVLEVNDKVILREFRPSDTRDYFNFYSIESVNRFVPDTMIPRNIDEARAEVGSIIDTFKNGVSVYWAIAEKGTDKLIGGCGFHDWNRYNARIEVAYDLHPDYWRKGITIECLAAIIKFAFFHMGVVRIQATTVVENEASNKLLLKFGFKYEGMLRKYKFFKGKMVDIMMFSYTMDDFLRDVPLGRFNPGYLSKK